MKNPYYIANCIFECEWCDEYGCWQKDCIHNDERLNILKILNGKNNFSVMQHYNKEVQEELKGKYNYKKWDIKSLFRKIK